MKKLLSRLLCAALSLCLCLSLVLSAEAELPVDISALPETVDQTLSCDDAFAKANECYQNGDYQAAEGYYLLALQKIDDSSLYARGDVANNLVLTWLHLDRAADAYSLCRTTLQNGLAPSVQDQYGYMLNLMVCGHACGFPAVLVLHEAVEKGYFSFDELNDLAEEEPGTYVKLLVGMLYNAVYMDMEGDTALGVMDYSYFPADDFDSLDNADLVGRLSKQLGSDPDNISEDDLNVVLLDLSRTEYLQFLIDILQAANTRNSDTFGETDPDIEELIEYLDALKGQEA